MSKEIDEGGWAISLGFYPGILIGARSYYAEDMTEFAFHVPAKVHAGFPEASPAAGGGVVFVRGSNFRPGDGARAASCRFGELDSANAPATAVSSALMACETPERYIGMVSLSVSVVDGGATHSALAAGQGGTGGATHRFAPTARVTGGSPSFGPDLGGTVVAVRGVGFEDGTRLGCRFGVIYPIAAAFLGGDLVECVTPAGGAGETVPIGVTSNGRDYTPGGGLFGSRAAFTYQESIRVTGVTPRSGVTGGRTPVFVTGAGFVNSTSLACRLGREIVPATYLSPFTLLCVAPEQPTGAGTVFIEVSNNGEDWTSQRTLFHFAPCPAGYYCMGYFFQGNAPRSHGGIVDDNVFQITAATMGGKDALGPGGDPTRARWVKLPTALFASDTLANENRTTFLFWICDDVFGGKGTLLMHAVSFSIQNDTVVAVSEGGRRLGEEQGAESCVGDETRWAALDAWADPAAVSSAAAFSAATGVNAVGFGLHSVIAEVWSPVRVTAVVSGTGAVFTQTESVAESNATVVAATIGATSRHALSQCRPRLRMS